MGASKVVQIVAMNKAIERLVLCCANVRRNGSVQVHVDVVQEIGDVWGRGFASKRGELLTFCVCTSELSSDEVDQVSHPDIPNYSNIGHIVCSRHGFELS